MTRLRGKPQVDLRADRVATADAVRTEDRPAGVSNDPQVEMFRERTVERPSVDVRPGGRRLGELLVARNLVSEKQMVEVLIQQSASGKRLGTLLVELGVLGERTLSQVLADQFGLSVVDLRRGTPDPQAVALLPEAMARSLVAIPVGHAGGAVKVAIPDPVDEAGIKRISAEIRQPVELALAPAGEIRRAIESSYRTLGGVARHVERFEATEGQRRLERPLHSVVNADSPVIQVVNLVLSQGLRDRASDVHVEPQEARIRVRYRIDGALHDVLALPDSMGPAVVSRIKIMSGLDIVERRRAQDGQMSLDLDGRRVDIRVSTAPTIWGEKVVLCLLERERPLLHLDDLGMSPPTHAFYARAARSPWPPPLGQRASRPGSAERATVAPGVSTERYGAREASVGVRFAWQLHTPSGGFLQWWTLSARSVVPTARGDRVGRHVCLRRGGCRRRLNTDPLSTGGFARGSIFGRR